MLNGSECKFLCTVKYLIEKGVDDKELREEVVYHLLQDLFLEYKFRKYANNEYSKKCDEVIKHL